MTLSITVAMRSFWFDPYLWVQLAGLALVPPLLELCLLGLAVGDPVLPVWLEFLLVAAVGIGPVLWMQLQRPFYIFGAIAVTLQPAQLTEDQRRLLTLGQSQRQRIVAIAIAVGLLPVLWQLYVHAAIAAPLTANLSSVRWLGLLAAAISFLFSHFFLQVAFSVLGILVNSPATFAATAPYPPGAIASSFTILGIQLRQIFPPLERPELPSPASLSSPAIAIPANEDPWAMPPTAAPSATAEMAADQPPTVATTPPPQDGESPSLDL